MKFRVGLFVPVVLGGAALAFGLLGEPTATCASEKEHPAKGKPAKSKPAKGHAGKRGGHGRPASPVVLADVVEREIKRGRSFIGTVEPSRTAEVDVEAAGYLETLLVDEGDAVEPGQVLARLRTDTLDIRIEAARAELRLRQAALAELKNGSRPQEIQQARARLSEAQADERTAKWKLGAVEKLRADKNISEEELRNARRDLATAVARREVLEAALSLVVAGPRKERIAQAEARVAVQVAEVAGLVDEKKRHVVTAPFKGFVVKRQTEVGAWLTTGEAVVDLVALDVVDVVVPVLEDAAVHLRRGMKVRVVIDGLPQPNVEGTIHRIVPVADRRSRTVPVKVRIQNVVQGNDVLIKAGMFARAQLAVGRPRKVLLAPKDAIVLGGRSPVVYVYDAKSQGARPVPVRLGVAVDDLIEVEGELKAGDRVVVRGNERIHPGMKLRPVEDK